MKRIVIDARTLRTSTGRYVERLLHYLQQIDRQHEYIVLLKPEDIAGWNPVRANFSKHVCPHKEFGFSEQIGFKKQLDGLRPDLVHFAMIQQPIWYRGRVVTTMHDLTTMRFNNPSKNSAVFRFKQQVYKYVVWRVAHKSDALITPSQFVAEDVLRYTGVKPGKITVTPEAADPITARAKPFPQLAGKRFLMYVGRPTPHKNLERLIEAFSLLRARHPQLILVLAGRKDANYERVEDEAYVGGVKNLLFTDYVTEGQLRWLYERCEAYVFPSLSEGFGLPGLEAMQHGAPVVASRSTSLPEVYGDAALYFDPYNVQEMSETIESVLSDKNLRAGLIKKGHARAATYSWRRMAEETLDGYKKVLKET
ncbi:MAG TPA: glycosyltransferase family 1 protein [Candidatus Saccharimonadales bacterium]|nr:glycosyltransferase family 1 protein [Candidatus Saccharimonadales bacterium]